mgnify:CR=1 FL=1
MQHGGWMRCGFSGGCGTMCLGLVGVTPSLDDIILSGWCFKALEAGTRGWLMQPHQPLVTHSLPRSLHWVLPVAACWGWLEQRGQLLNIHRRGVINP